MDDIALADLVEQLRSITRRTGLLSAADMSDLTILLALPVYVDTEMARGVLLGDLDQVIDQLPNADDALIARYLLIPLGK